eukprot:359436-Chlamydomonas_euryale.AAC.3
MGGAGGADELSPCTPLKEGNRERGGSVVLGPRTSQTIVLGPRTFQTIVLGPCPSQTIVLGPLTCAGETATPGGRSHGSSASAGHHAGESRCASRAQTMDPNFSASCARLSSRTTPARSDNINNANN